MTPKERAAASAEAMWSKDKASKWLGFELVEVDEGTAELALTVQPHHCNGHGTCHGGILFSLADSAFAFACNSRNQSTVAQHNVITYIASPKAGDRLTASAREISLEGRNGIYDVRITDDAGARIAEFRGLSRSVPGALFDEQRR